MCWRGATPSIRGRQTGFSLLEILVAFTVFAIVAGTALQVVSTVLRGTEASQQRIEALAVAEGLIARVGRDISAQDGSQTGSADGGRYAWRMERQTMAEERKGVRPVNVVVRVSPSDAPGREVMLESVVLVGPGTGG